MAYQEYLKENNHCIIFTHGFNIKKYELLKKIVKKNVSYILGAIGVIEKNVT